MYISMMMVILVILRSYQFHCLLSLSMVDTISIYNMCCNKKNILTSKKSTCVRSLHLNNLYVALLTFVLFDCLRVIRVEWTEWHRNAYAIVMDIPIALQFAFQPETVLMKQLQIVLRSFYVCDPESWSLHIRIIQIRTNAFDIVKKLLLKKCMDVPVHFTIRMHQMTANDAPRYTCATCITHGKKS